MSQVARFPNNQSFLNCLKEMRNFGGPAITTGLADDVVLAFLDEHPDLPVAVERAYDKFVELQESHADLLALAESEQIARIHAGLTNFYAADAVNPYVAVAGAGPWVITLKGAVVYDCGGYGMLGLGHVPSPVVDAMNQPHVMANIMTANVSQLEFIKRLKQEVGHTRPGGTPYASFLCVNSGSEAMSVASRLADANTKTMTDPGGRYEGFEVRGLTLSHSFHGRTARPARYSNSSAKVYKKHLASFRDDRYLITVEPNDVAALEAIFARARDEKFFIEAFLMEPVMGEGNPGLAIEPAFYRRARELTREHGTVFVVDSIQAGLRANGVLSLVDYPGFQDLDAPDMESWSKALNAGQYPLSVLALSESAAALYKPGLYGNTMTTNPRTLDVAVAVLDSFTPELRENIRVRGRELVERMAALADETDGAIVNAQGTGLLLSCELDEKRKVFGANSVEDYLRKHGLAVIHGGEHSLRFTPVFNLGTKEVDLIIDLTRDALINGPTV